MGKSVGVYGVLAGSLKEKNHLEDPSVNGRIILIWIFMK
jgi:hypothetical protein